MRISLESESISGLQDCARDFLKATESKITPTAENFYKQITLDDGIQEEAIKVLREIFKRGTRAYDLDLTTNYGFKINGVQVIVMQRK